MSDTRWLDLMGIGSAKPNESNCPKILSRQVKGVWASVIKDQMPVIASMDHATAWNFALSVVFAAISDLGYAWLDPAVSGRPAQEKITVDVKARRALMVAVMDTTDALRGLTISNIARTVSFSGGLLTLSTTADCKLARGIDEKEWLSNLVKNRFKVFGYEYRLFGLPAGSTIKVLKRPIGDMQFVSEMVIPSTFIPSDAAIPLVNPDVYAKFIIDKVWLPAIRVFKFKTTKRKNSLL